MALWWIDLLPNLTFFWRRISSEMGGSVSKEPLGNERKPKESLPGISVDFEDAARNSSPTTTDMSSSSSSIPQLSVCKRRLVKERSICMRSMGEKRQVSREKKKLYGGRVAIITITKKVWQCSAEHATMWCTKKYPFFSPSHIFFVGDIDGSEGGEVRILYIIAAHQGTTFTFLAPFLMGSLHTLFE